MTQGFILSSRASLIGSGGKLAIRDACLGEAESFDLLLCQLHEDWENMKREDYVSELCIVCPRAKGKTTQAELGKRISSAFRGEESLRSRVRFNRFLSSLSRYFRGREASEFQTKMRFRMARGNLFEPKWCALQDEPHRELAESISSPSRAWLGLDA